MAQIAESVDEQSQMTKVLSAIQQIANVTVGQFDVKLLAQQVVETLTRILNAEASSIFLLDEDKQLLKMIAGAGYFSSLVGKAEYEIGEGVTGTIATGKVITTRKDKGRHEIHPEWKGKYDNEQWGDSGEKCWSFLGVPLKFKDKVVGVLKVENKKQDDRYVDFTPQDQQIIEILASEIAAVIENTKLYDQRQIRAMINLLNEVAKGIQELNEINIIGARFDEVLQRIVESALKLLNAKICHLRLIEENKLVIKAMAPKELEWERVTPKILIGKKEQGISGRVVELMKPAIIENVSDWNNVEWEGEKYIHCNQATSQGLKALYSMPLIVKDEHENEHPLGTLNTYLDRSRFSEIEIEILKIFVTESAIAISIAQDIIKRMGMQKMLDEAGKMAAIGKLTSGVAHGIKNPLQILEGTITELKKLPNQELNEYITEIENQKKRMLDIISIFSRFATPEINDEIDINVLIDDTIKKVRISNGIKVSRDYKALSNVRCDSKQIQQVFENLILNACESMKNGGNLKIMTLSKDNKIKIVFEDGGTGIPDGLIRKIFDPFYTTKKGKGSGLGLYISQYIVQNHKGEIEVESKEGKGAIFTVTLPILKEET